jgi:Tfp pilus assembly protein PilX
MALLACLIFLAALTLLGLSASADTILQNQLVANFKEAERARQSALSALSWAESWLLELDGPVPDYCQKPCDGLYVHQPGELPTLPEYESPAWWQDHAYEIGADPLATEAATAVSSAENHKPVWLIEELHRIPPTGDDPKDLRVWYRIMARGNGRTQTAVSVIESIVVRSWPTVEYPASSGSHNGGSCADARHRQDCGRVSWRERR